MRGKASAVSPPVLEVRDLRVRYPSAMGGTAAVDGLSFSVGAGEALALVGESGCGKSTTALTLMRLLPGHAQVEGEVRLAGEDLLSLPERGMRALRGDRIAMVFQEPMSALNPVQRVGTQIAEVLRRHRGMGRRQARQRAVELLERVRVPDAARRVDDYPHQFSGGQRQRVMIAMAIACDPQILVADEPTASLDADVAAQILGLLDGLRRDLGMALVLITHDLELVSRWSDRVIVMHHGQAMEELPAADLFARATHSYTQGLIGASVRPGAGLHYRTDRLAEVRVSHDANGYAFRLERPQIRASTPRCVAAEPLLTASDLVVRHGAGSASPPVLDGASLDIAAGETLGLVGASGSGKSTLSQALLRLVPTSAGSIRFRGQEITHVGGAALRGARRGMQMVFQDPFASLNPRQSVQTILEGPLVVHEALTPAERQKRIATILDRVGLHSDAIHRWPHEFSGGQRQRIAIARALILRPALVIYDEPVSALDASVQAQILNLLTDLKAEYGLSYLFISHDLAVVRYISDRIVSMSAGRVRPLDVLTPLSDLATTSR